MFLPYQMAELKFVNLSTTLEEKRAEGAELHAICEELIGKLDADVGTTSAQDRLKSSTSEEVGSHELQQQQQQQQWQQSETYSMEPASKSGPDRSRGLAKKKPIRGKT